MGGHGSTQSHVLALGSALDCDRLLSLTHTTDFLLNLSKFLEKMANPNQLAEMRLDNFFVLLRIYYGAINLNLNHTL